MGGPRAQPTQPEPAPDTTAGFGGWVPELPPTPDADELAARWAPPAPGGRHRAVDEPDDLDALADPAVAGAEWDEFGDETIDVDHTTAGVATDDADGEPATADEPREPRRHRINGRWGRFAELWVPEPMRNARVDPGRRGMIVLVLVAALAATAAAVGVWRDRPEPRPIETATVAAVSDTGPSTASSGSAPPTGSAAPSPDPADVAATSEIVVSVTGLVVNPGVVHLPPDSRVTDAIAAAGGTQPGANLTGMNLAAKLADGDSVVVTDTGSAASAPAAAPAGSSGPGSAPAGLVNLNTADEAALDTLPGVGPVMAQNIIAWRESNGRFSNVEQLQEISGIGPSRYAQISALVTVG